MEEIISGEKKQVFGKNLIIPWGSREPEKLLVCPRERRVVSVGSEDIYVRL